MATKKSASKTTKTATPKAKYYIVMDADQDIVCQGEWDEVKDALEEYIEDGDSDDRAFVDELTIHELGAGKKLKFIPAVPASVAL